MEDGQLPSRRASKSLSTKALLPWRSSLCRIFVAICTSSLLLSVGCSRFRQYAPSKYATFGRASHDAVTDAKALNAEALELANLDQLDKAEKKFRQALEIDVSYGPAHNNLGQIYLKRHQLYLAAWEFESAMSLMPSRVEPIVNMGLVFETAGDLNLAASYYEQAAALHPEHSQAIGNLVRVYVKQDQATELVRPLLQKVVLLDNRGVWVKWAKTLLATRFRANNIVSQTDAMHSSSLNHYPRTDSDSGFENLPEPVELEPDELRLGEQELAPHRTP